MKLPRKLFQAHFCNLLVLAALLNAYACAALRSFESDSLDTAGIMQYGVVGGIIVMYLGYTVDFWLLQREQDQRDAKKAVSKTE